MSRTKLFMVCTISVLLVPAVLLVLFWPRSYESTCGLAYRDSAEGSNRYAFDDGDENPAVLKRPGNLRRDNRLDCRTGAVSQGKRYCTAKA